MKHLALAALLLGALGVLRATAAPPSAPDAATFLPYFQPFRTDQAALSPDGQYLAYSLRDGDKLKVVVLNVDHPDKATALATVATDETSTPSQVANQDEKTPAQIRWMRWTTPSRLVVDTNGVFAVGSGGSWTNYVGAVFALDADGRNAGLIATPRDVLEQIPNESTFGPPPEDQPPAVWTPDQPVPEAGSTSNVDPTYGATTPDPSEPATFPTLAPQAGPITTVLAQNLRVYDLAPGKPGDVLLETFGNSRDDGSQRVSFVLLNTVTGKMHDLSGDIVPPNMAGLTDLSGHVRVLLPSTLLTAFPHAYEYTGPTGASRPQPLDRLVGAGGAFSISPANYFGQREIPLGFGANPNDLYFASNIGRDTYGVYSLDLRSGHRTKVAFEDPTYDLAPPVQTFGSRDQLVVDRFNGQVVGVRYAGKFAQTLWLNQTFQDVQQQIETALPNHSIRILEWDSAARRFLVLADAPGDAGAYYVFNRFTGTLFQFVRRAPSIDDGQTSKTYPFSFDEKNGTPIQGIMVVPNHPRVTPMPVIVLCPSMPWDRVSPDFQSRAQALAEMGFMVVEYNGRGAWGFGLRERAALAPGYDLTQVDDLMATLDYIEGNYRVDAKRVAVMGETQGGFIALRALQMHPNRFRCAIAINAPVDLGNWLTTQRWTDNDVGPSLTRQALGDKARFDAAPLVKHPDQIKQPIMLLHYPGPDGAPRTFDYLAAKSFASAVRRAGGGVEFDDLSMDYMRGLPQARSEVYAKIDSFLNLAIFDYTVKVGPVKERR